MPPEAGRWRPCAELGVLQLGAGRRCAPCCAACGAPVGGPGDQLALLAGRLQRAGLAGRGGALACARGCGELYCGAACRRRAEARGHFYLCCGPLDAAHPLYRLALLAVTEARPALRTASALLVRHWVGGAAGAAAEDVAPVHGLLALAAGLRLPPPSEKGPRGGAEATLAEAWRLLRAGFAERVGAAAEAGSTGATAARARFEEWVGSTDPAGAFARLVGFVDAYACRVCLPLPVAARLRECLKALDSPQAAFVDDIELSCELEALIGAAPWEGAGAAGAKAKAGTATDRAAKIRWCLERLPDLEFFALGLDALGESLPRSPGRHSCIAGGSVAFKLAEGEEEGGAGRHLVWTCRPAISAEEHRGGTSGREGDHGGWWCVLDDAEAEGVEARAARLRDFGVERCDCELCVFERGLGALLAADGDREAAAERVHAFLLRLGRLEKFTAGIRIAEAALEAGVSSGGIHFELGGCHLNLGAYAEAYDAWRAGHARHPDHREMGRYVAKLEVYGAGEEEEEGAGRAEWLRDGGGDDDADASLEVRPTSAQDVVMTRKPVLAEADCRTIVELAEAHARGRGGWATARHASVPTTDIPVCEVPEVLRLFNAAWAARLLPLLRARYLAPDGGERVWVHDAFVTKYAAESGQDSLPAHTDQSSYSFTIALNRPGADFEGGGTWFEELDATLSPACGCCTMFPGELSHAGQRVTRGERYIIAVFVLVSRDGEEEEEEEEGAEDEKSE